MLAPLQLVMWFGNKAGAQTVVEVVGFYPVVPQHAPALCGRWLDIPARETPGTSERVVASRLRLDVRPETDHELRTNALANVSNQRGDVGVARGVHLKVAVGFLIEKVRKFRKVTSF